MCDQTPLRLCLELERGQEPIAGRLHGPDGASIEFVGWLELTQALEAAQLTGIPADGPETLR